MYTIRLVNAGNMNAHVATMTDPLLPQVNFAGSLASTSGTPSYDAVARQVTWNGVVDANAPVTVTFAVTVNTGLVSGTLISNYATVDDEINNPTQLAPSTVTVEDAKPRRFTLFLPIVMRGESGVAQLPDLVVTDINVTPANPSAGQPVDVAVTIKNQGNYATPACFWIDAYINPTRLPITVNKGWFDAGSEGGLVWPACALGVGESITLHYNDSHYWPSYSQFNGLFQSPRTYALYAQVDSYDLSTTYGAVYESDEQNNV